MRERGGRRQRRMARSATRVIAWCHPALMRTCMLCQALSKPRPEIEHGASGRRRCEAHGKKPVTHPQSQRGTRMGRAVGSISEARDYRLFSFHFRSTCHSHRHTQAHGTRIHGAAAL